MASILTRSGIGIRAIGSAARRFATSPGARIAGLTFAGGAAEQLGASVGEDAARWGINKTEQGLREAARFMSSPQGRNAMYNGLAQYREYELDNPHG